ncbi:unnamed protein product [Amoebophrya sp. A120]|nr:unnamed protein product [Amoebophrya sp. A120]|eukprot:GSA120T00023982001.1
MPGVTGTSGDASRRPICVAYREGRCEFGAWCFWSHGNDGVTSIPGRGPPGRRDSFDPAFVPPPTRDPLNRPVMPDGNRRASFDRAGSVGGRPGSSAKDLPSEKKAKVGFFSRLLAVLFRKKEPPPDQGPQRRNSFRDYDTVKPPPPPSAAKNMEKNMDQVSSSSDERVNVYDTLDEDAPFICEEVNDGEDALRDYMRQRENFSTQLVNTIKVGDILSDKFLDVDLGSSSSQPEHSGKTSPSTTATGAGVAGAAAGAGLPPTGGGAGGAPGPQLKEPKKFNIYDHVDSTKTTEAPKKYNIYDDAPPTAQGADAPASRKYNVYDDLPPAADGAAARRTSNVYDTRPDTATNASKEKFKTFNPTPNVTPGAGPNLGPSPRGGDATASGEARKSSNSAYSFASKAPSQANKPEQPQGDATPAGWANARSEPRESKVYNKVHPQPAEEENPSYRRRDSGGTTAAGDDYGNQPRSYATGESKQQQNFYSRLGAKMGGRGASADQQPSANDAQQEQRRNSGPGPAMGSAPTGQSYESKKQKPDQQSQQAGAASSSDHQQNQNAQQQQQSKKSAPASDQKQDQGSSGNQNSQHQSSSSTTSDQQQQQANGNNKRSRRRKNPNSGYFWYEGYYYYFDADYNVYWWWDDRMKQYHQCISKEEQEKQSRSRNTSSTTAGTSSRGGTGGSSASNANAPPGFPSFGPKRDGRGTEPQFNQQQSNQQQQQKQQQKENNKTSPGDDDAGGTNNKKSAPPDMSRTAANFMTSAEDASDEQIKVNQLIMQLIAEMQEYAEKDLADRKKVFKKMCLEWHPDKHSNDAQFVAKCAFQFLQEKKESFLKN